MSQLNSQRAAMIRSGVSGEAWQYLPGVCLACTGVAKSPNFPPLCLAINAPDRISAALFSFLA
jgi:hypothetical protein